jgi:small-conductance mechanosensitive channel
MVNTSGAHSSKVFPIGHEKKYPTPLLCAAMGMALSYYSYPFFAVAEYGVYLLAGLLFFLTAVVSFLRALEFPLGERIRTVSIAGILAAAVGFGSQQAISNIVSGIFMVLFKPFRVGDHIDLGGENKGKVVDVSLRHTTIRNSENRMIIVPNSVLNNQSIINSSILHSATCALINVGIGYGSDINRAIVIIQEEATKHHLLIDNRTEAEKKTNIPQVIVRVIEWAESSINLRAWAWAANTDDAFILKCDLLHAIKERFEQEGIEIPFPYTNVIRKPQN